jgi:hypothetical protein
VQNVARRGFRNPRDEGDDLYYRRLNRGGEQEDRWFHSLSAAAARHTCRRASSVLLAGLLVAAAGLGNDHAVDA